MPINDNTGWTLNSGNVIWNGNQTSTSGNLSIGGCVPEEAWVQTSKFFPFEKVCPACNNCTGAHELGQLHWTGREAIVFMVCTGCATSFEIDPIEGGYAAFAARELCLSITERTLNGEEVHPDDHALLDWLNARLLEEIECIKDALALVETVRASTSHR